MAENDMVGLPMDQGLVLSLGGDDPRRTQQIVLAMGSRLQVRSLRSPAAIDHAAEQRARADLERLDGAGGDALELALEGLELASQRVMPADDVFHVLTGKFHDDFLGYGAFVTP